MTEDRDYKVGYGKPPVHSRFKPGQSGHCAGRPKERLSELDELIKAVSRKVKLPDGRRLTKFQVGIEQLKLKSLKGNMAASALLTQALDATKAIPSTNPCVADFFETDLGHLERP